MKKGFTMIELIFVIVILGVLASVAIPRLAATRDDAEVAKAATNLTTAVSDLTAYYTAKGSFKNSQGTANISDFTKFTNALDKSGKLMVKGKTECVKVVLPTLNNNANASDKVELDLQFTLGDPVCKQLAKLPGVKAMCGKGDQDTISAGTGNCKIQIGGSGGIQF